ncbi:hypothetical protein ElyMa_003593300, partial [Elysia marginata]
RVVTPRRGTIQEPSPDPRPTAQLKPPSSSPTAQLISKTSTAHHSQLNRYSLEDQCEKQSRPDV